ncbi:MAG: hypothetical protein ACKVPJ_01555 [Chitinophagales bacterium]
MPRNFAVVVAETSPIKRLPQFRAAHQAFNRCFFLCAAQHRTAATPDPLPSGCYQVMITDDAKKRFYKKLIKTE